MTTQLTIAFGHNNHMGREDFVISAANRAALEAIDHWPGWPSRVMLLTGPAASGKSHLARIFQAASGAVIADARTADLQSLAADWTSHPLILEDCGPGIDEAGLFHALNAVEAAKGSLLLTARERPAQWGLVVPDLLSRLRAATPIAIDEPDDRLLEDVIAKQFVDRQTSVDPQVVRYLVQRMERSFAAASDLVDRLDRAAIARGSAVTRALAAEILGSDRSAEPKFPGFDDPDTR